MTGQYHEEKLSILAHYTRWASSNLAIGSVSHSNAFLSNQRHKEKQPLKENICSLTLSLDHTYKKTLKASSSLKNVGDDLSALNIPDSLGDQVTLFVRGISRKDKVLTCVWAAISTTHAYITLVQEDLNIHVP